MITRPLSQYRSCPLRCICNGASCADSSAETRMLTRKKLMEAPFNDSQSQLAEKALRLVLDNKVWGPTVFFFYFLNDLKSRE